MTRAIEAVAEIFSWVGFGVGMVLAVVALVLLLADGAWTQVRAVVEDLDGHRAVRWFGEDGGVNEAPLSEAQERDIAGKDMADIFVRRGTRDRMRLTRHNPLVRNVGLLAAGMLGLGVLALLTSFVLLFAAG